MDHTEIEVIVGVDMAKGDHCAQAITIDGKELFARPLANDQADIEVAIDAAEERYGGVCDRLADATSR